MNPVPNRALADLERKLTLLLMEVRGTVTFERVMLYVAKFATGKPLSEYLHDDTVPQKERAALGTTLIEILLAKTYDRLPELKPMANGNAAPTTSRIDVPSSARRPNASAEPLADEPTPDPDEIRAMIRAEVRRELANIFDIAARVLREGSNTH